MFRVRNIAETVQTPARPESHKALTVEQTGYTFQLSFETTRNRSEHLLTGARGHVVEAFTKGLLAAQSACAGAARAG